MQIIEGAHGWLLGVRALALSLFDKIVLL